MINIKPFGPSIGKVRISKKFFDVLNKEFDNKSKSKKIDYKRCSTQSKIDFISEGRHT